MKLVNKLEYTRAKIKSKASQMSNETITISDSEFENLSNYLTYIKDIPDPIIDDPDEPQDIYTITFKDGDEIVRTVTGPIGTYVSVPYVEKEGYEFLGWSLDGEKVTMPVDGIYDSDITYIAVWEKIEQEEPIEPQEKIYTITFKDDDEIIRTVTGPIGTYVSSPDVEKEGYEFLGWSLDGYTPSIKKFENVSIQGLLVSDDDIGVTYIAVWKKIEPVYNYSECDFGVNQWGYNIISLEDRTVSIKYCGNRYTLTEANIPETVEYNSVLFSVTSIGEYAFAECSGLTSVNIHDSIINIGVCAFKGCTNLTNIDIPNSVTNIGSAAFRKCTNLTNIDIPNSITSIGSDAFVYCSGLTSINIPDSVTSIGACVFSCCGSLTSVTIGSGVTSFGNYAFQDCSSLTSITIYSANINFIDLNIDHQITIYVLSELVNDYKTYYEKDIFLGKVNILPIE